MSETLAERRLRDMAQTIREEASHLWAADGDYLDADACDIGREALSLLRAAVMLSDGPSRPESGYAWTVWDGQVRALLSRAGTATAEA